MSKITLEGFQKRVADNRYIDKQARLNEDINFPECDAQLFLLTFNPGVERPLHKHEELRVTFVRSGSGRFRIDGEEQTATTGDVILTMPFKEHSLEVLGSEPLNLAEFIIPGK